MVEGGGARDDDIDDDDFMIREEIRGVEW